MKVSRFFIFLLVLFFKKRRIFPALMIAYLSFQFVATMIDDGLVHSRTVRTVTTNVHTNASPAVGRVLLPLIVSFIFLLYLTRNYTPLPIVLFPFFFLLIHYTVNY